MAGALPLPTLLSQVLVAFTIELDNEFECRMAHRTTVGSAGDTRDAPWLVSLVMWSNLMRLIGEEGVPVAELQNAGGNLKGMQRWGYVVVEPDRGATGPRPPRREWVVRPTAAGRRAQGVWAPLFAVIEARWQARFGEREMSALGTSLAAAVDRLELELPEYFPVLGYGLRAKLPHGRPRTAPPGEGAARLTLPAALSKLLLAFTLDFERESEVALAIGANVLRLLGEDGTHMRDLPRLAGVSKEAIAMAVSFLERGRYVVVEPDPAAGRVKLMRLTPKGGEARDEYRRLLAATEERWRARFGEDGIRDLRDALEPLVGEGGTRASPLFLGLEPPPDGWRASVRRPDVLPHQPIVLHRGGYPDGS